MIAWRTTAFFDGLGTASQEIRSSLGEGETFYLNPWLDFSFFTKNASRTPVVAGIHTALVGSLWVIGLVILFALATSA